MSTSSTPHTREGKVPDDIVGHVCGDDGCKPLTREMAGLIWEEAMRQKAARAERMPDEEAAVRAMCDAHSRLIELGWSDTSYAPCDMRPLQLIEPGSSGIHDGYRDAERRFWIVDATDTWPSRPALFRDPSAPARLSSPQKAEP